LHSKSSYSPLHGHAVRTGRCDQFFVDLVDRFYVGVAGDPLSGPCTRHLCRSLTASRSVPDAVLGGPRTYGEERGIRGCACPPPFVIGPGERTRGCGTCSERSWTWNRLHGSPRPTRSSCATTSRWRPTRSSIPLDRPGLQSLNSGLRPSMRAATDSSEIACRDATKSCAVPSASMWTAGCWRRGCSRLSLRELDAGPAPAVDAVGQLEALRQQPGVGHDLETSPIRSARGVDVASREHDLGGPRLPDRRGRR